MLTATQECCSNRTQLTVRRWLDDARRTGRKDVCAGKRPHARYTWSVSVIVEAQQNGRTVRSLHAATCNISSTGLSVRCNAHLERGTAVRVRMIAWGGSVQGVVRYCAPTPGAFHVGIEFLLDDRQTPAPGQAA